jgi:hypothetical protein
MVPLLAWRLGGDPRRTPLGWDEPQPYRATFANFCPFGMLIFVYSAC